MKVDVLAACADLDEKMWNGLVERSKLPSIFMTWQWQSHWAGAFAADGSLELLTARDEDGTLAGLLPLYEETPGQLRILGGVDVSDYLDVIALAGREEDVWRALLQHRSSQSVEWDLHAIRAVSPTLTLLPALAPAHGLRVAATLEERCPLLALPESWDEYLARLSGKDRHELRRKMRKLERELPGVSARSHVESERWDAELGEFL